MANVCASLYTDEMFNWLKKIFGIYSPQSKSKRGDYSISLYNELEKKSQIARAEKNTISQSPIDWFGITIYKRTKRKPVKAYHAYIFGEILSLSNLREERLNKEARVIKIIEDAVKSKLDDADYFIKQQNSKDAQKALDDIIEKIVQVKDPELHQRYQYLQTNLSNLIAKLEQEKLVRLAEERRKREAEEQRQKEAELRARIEKEKREREELQRREIEALRLAEAARKKEQAEQEERQRLIALSSILKNDWQKYKQLLEDNGIKYLYHFTDIRNITSIKKHGGLLSWHYCKTHNIIIPSPGGNEGSRNLDKRYKLEDYVRLSFCTDHPMQYRLELDGCMMVLLKIKIDVAWFKDTQFSDKNATDSSHKHGGNLDDLRGVNFAATQRTYISRNDPAAFKLHQAEVMVRTFIPKEYIINLDDFRI